jgi:uncharacterized protein YdaU (DUF1376 family)
MFYPKDWWDFKVRRMSVAARGAYWDIISMMWKDSKDQYSIIDNDNLLAQAIGISVEEWMKLRQEIQRDFDPILQEKNGRLISTRLKKAVAEQRRHRKKQSIKGKKSAEKRRNRGSTAVQPDTQPEGKSSSSSSVFSLQSSSSNKETLRKEGSLTRSVQKPIRASLSDDEWLAGLKKNPAYEHVDFPMELGKMDAWLTLPKNRHRKKTKQFVLGWLNGIDKPLQAKGGLHVGINDKDFTAGTF